MKRNKKNIFKTSLKTIIYFAKLQPKLAIVSSFLNIISGILPVFVAFISGQIVTNLVSAVENKDINIVLRPLILLFVVGIISTITRYLQWTVDTTFRLKVEIEIDKIIYSKLVKIPFTQRETKSFADKFSAVEKFSGSSTHSLYSITSSVSAIFSMVAAFIAIFVAMPMVALLIFIISVPRALIMNSKNKKDRKFYKDNYANQRRSYEIIRYIGDFESKLNGLNDFFMNEWLKNKETHTKGMQNIQKKRDLSDAVIDTASSAVETGAMIYVVFQIIAGKFAIGLFATYQSLITQFSNSIDYFINLMSGLSENLLNADDYFEFLALPEENAGLKLGKLTSPPKIEFKNVSFKYPESEELVIENLNLTFNSGEDIALVGENGAGKTTIVNLALGFYLPTKGDVFINDISTRKLDLDDYLKQVSALSQNFSKYNFADLGDNIWFGDIRKAKTKKSLTAAFDRAGGEKILEKLPHKFHQMLSKTLDEKNARDLSGGEWQRVALARGFFAENQVLILDEPTSAVDAKAEAEIFDKIMKDQKDKTTIIISHRFSTVRRADKIFVLDKGKITESGSHEELMEKGGTYAEMFNLQAEGYK